MADTNTTTDNLPRRGNTADNGNAYLQPDERAVVDHMRAVQNTHRPGVVTLYWNGSNWVMYPMVDVVFLPRRT